MKTIDKAREIAEGNAEIEKAAMQMAKWLLQKIYDRLYEKRTMIRTNGWNAYVAFDDIDDVLNDLNGTRKIDVEKEEDRLHAKPSLSLFDSAMKAVGNAQFGHLK